MKIYSYTPTREKELMHLEELITQGRQIQLKIKKDHFLQRAEVFQHYRGYYVEIGGEIAGSGICAMTEMKVEGKPLKAAVGLDIKVHPDHRRKGVGRSLVKKLYQISKDDFNTTDYLYIFKKVNRVVAQLGLQANSGFHFYPFVYLTIPSGIKLGKMPTSLKPVQFSVGLSERTQLDPRYYYALHPEVGFFRTHLMYSLKIVRIGLVLKTLIRFLSAIDPGKYRALPKEGQAFSYSLIYGLNHHNLSLLPQLLEAIASENTDYAMICCRKKDPIYMALKSYAINKTAYYLASTIKWNSESSIEVDARCL